VHSYNETHKVTHLENRKSIFTSSQSVLRTTTQVNGKVGIRPPLPQKPLNRSSPKFAWVITSGTTTSMQKFITIRLPPFPQICENDHQVTRLVFFGFFSDSLQPRPLQPQTFGQFSTRQKGLNNGDARL